MLLKYQFSVILFSIVSLGLVSNSYAAAGLDDPGFESMKLGVVPDGGDIDTWKSWNGNYSVVNTIANTGSKSVKVGVNTTAGSNFRQSDKPAGAPSSIENNFWTYGCWVYYDSTEAGNNPASDAFNLEFFATNNWNITLTHSLKTIVPGILNNGQWTYIEQTVYVGQADLSAWTPGTPDYNNRVTNRVVVLLSQNSPGQSGTFYVDNFVLYKQSFSFQVAPTNNASVPLAEPMRLSWTNPKPNDPADSVVVDVYLSTDPIESSWTTADLVVDKQAVKQVDITVLPNTTYYWKILAYDTGYAYTAPENPSEQTEILSFNVGTPATPDVWSYPDVSLDPADRLDDNSITAGDPAVILGEWNTSGNMDRWTESGLTGVSVSGGKLSGTGTTDSPYIQLSGISPTLDLDFAYFDYLQFRLKLPVGFNDDIILYYGTTTSPGVSTDSDLNLVIPSSEVPSDGAWHTYRLDLGLIVWWRDFLSNIRLYPLGNSGNGQTFELDYVEVGDLPGDVLLVNYDLNIHSGETLADCMPLQSKHAVCWYSPESYNRYADWDPQVHGRRALRMIEESYQVYRKKLHYDEPFESFDLWRRDGNRYKINHVTWYDGFWCGGWAGFMHIGINGWGLLDEGWGNPMPHEFGHYMDGHQGGPLTGGHWESHANFYRNSRNLHYADVLGNLSGMMGDWILVNSNYRQDHGNFIYWDFRIHHALADFGHEFGLPDAVADVWIVSPREMTIYEKLEQILSPSDDLGDVVANGMRHWPFLDFNDGDEFKAILWPNGTVKSLFQYRVGSHLIPCQEKPGWYRCPFERSPEKFAYMSHELVPSSTDITVELEGFDLLGNSEDWRWSLVATDDEWVNPRYGGIYSPADGAQTFTMQAGETKLFLIVVSAPTDSSLNLEWTDNKNLVDKHPDRLHYAYEVSLTGAMPAIAERQKKEQAGSGSVHSNGGGWVDSYAQVDASVYVGPNAKVLGYAQVRGNARIEDYAIVKDTSIVRDNAVVSGHALVEGSSVIEDNARVRDRAYIKGATVKNNALAEDYALVNENSVIQDNAIARGCSSTNPGTNFSLGGYAISDYDLTSGDDLTDGVHFSHVPWGDWYRQYWWDTLAKPAGLIASYRVEAADGQICWDEFGSQHALMRGNVQRVLDTSVNSYILELNGVDQYLVLDRSVCDLVDGSVSIRINPDDNTDRPLLYLGGSASAYLQLVLNSSGQAGCTITDGAATATVTSGSAIPVGSWTSLVVTLDGAFCRLYINGVQVAQTATSLVPVDVLGANDYSQAEAYYVGRDWTGDVFDGKVDDIRFYNIAMTSAQVANEVRRSGECIGAFLFDGEMDFNGTTTKLESGVRNGLVRRIEANIYPRTSDDVTYYEAVLDSNDERDGSFSGSGIGLDNRQFVVRLDTVGFWNTGVSVALNQWQHVALEFDGRTAEFYVNGVLRGTRSYSATAANVASKNYRIGAGQSATDTYHYFDGKIKEVKIFDRIPLPETDPPTPNPATWATAPESVNSAQITMTATIGTDASGVVEYYFQEHSDNPGATDSGWQSSPIYTDSQLEPGTEYIYSVRMRDAYGIETQPSLQVVATTYYLSDFNTDGIVDAQDLDIFCLDWLAEITPTDPSLVSHWAFNEESGTVAYDSIAGNNGTVMGGASLDGSGALAFDGNNDYVDLPIGNVISTLTDSTFAMWVNFSNSGGAWQRVFDFGNGTGSYLFLSPRIGTTGSMRFAIKAPGDYEQTATASSTLPSGQHHVAVTLNDVAGTITVYLDGAVVATKSSATHKPSDLGITTQNWIGRSQYSADGYYNGSMNDFGIYNRCLDAQEIATLAATQPVEGNAAASRADLDRSGIVDLGDFARFAKDWLQSN